MNFGSITEHGPLGCYCLPRKIYDAANYLTLSIHKWGAENKTQTRAAQANFPMDMFLRAI